MKQIALLISVLLLTANAVTAQSLAITDVTVIDVAPPTGQKEADRASILDALARARPGSTVQFSPGTYLVGEVISIETPRLTLLGHADGTMLRGCEESGLDEVERAMIAFWSGETDPAEFTRIAHSCGLFELTGGHATIRNLTFEQAWSGLILGCCEGATESKPTDGGYVIEANTFRNIVNGIRAVLWAKGPSVIRGNRFVNTFHALSAFGSHLHMLDNHVSAPEPAHVAAIGYPGFAIGLVGGSMPDGVTVPCHGNVVAGNRVEGHPDGILIISYPGATCRDNVIRENTIIAATPPFDPARPSGEYLGGEEAAPFVITGVPLRLFAIPDTEGGTTGVEGTVVEGNTVTGADGVAIELVGASGNRIANNVVTDVQRRDPFPGNLVWMAPEWAGANGAGIWISTSSDRNEIVGNIISGTAGEAIVVEGEENYSGASCVDPETVVMRQVDAYNERDLDAFLRYYRENATYHFIWPDTSYTVSGKAAIRERFSFLNEVPPDGFGVDVTDTLVTGRFVVLAERFRSAPADAPDVLLVYEVRESLISNTWVHYPEPMRQSIAVEEGEWPKVELTATELKRYEGTYGTPEDPVIVALNDEERLEWSAAVETFEMVPEGDHVFAAGRYEEGRLVEIFHPDIRIAFRLDDGEVVGYEMRRAEGGDVLHYILRIR